MDEKPRDAFFRGLREELDLDLEASASFVHVRSCLRIGAVDLPSDRHGERPVADDVHDGPLSHVTMRKKSYWGIFAILKDQGLVSPVPNGTEVEEARWCSLGEAEELIDQTVRPEKAEILRRGLAEARRQLHGIK